jgi:hypothetical protein
MIDRASLRMSAALLLAGQVLYIVVTQFHAAGDANDHPAIFAVYAGSGIWKGDCRQFLALNASGPPGHIADCLAESSGISLLEKG